MYKVIKNSLITILIAILVFVIVYFVYDIIKVKPINMEQAKQNNTDGPNEGLDTNKLFENINESNNKNENEENNEEKANNNTEVLNGTVSSKEDKAIELVKKKWGSTEGVYFSNMAINSRGNYIVTVNDSITSKTLAFYEVDVENEMVKER